VAQTSVTLKPGFHAKIGSNVRIYTDPTISDCNSNSKLTSTLNGSYQNDYPKSPVSSNSILNEYEPKESYEENIVKEELSNPNLQGNYPNPHSSYTIIQYSVTESSPIRIFITDVYGRQLTELVDIKSHQIGNFEVMLDMSRLKAGVYFYTLQTDKYSQTKRMVVLK